MRDLRIEARLHTFDEMAGNADTIKIIKSIILSKRFPMGLLFYGPIGCGKSVLARLVAKSLLCDHLETTSREPCCKCPSCNWFQTGQGIFPPWGYREVNCAQELGYDIYKGIFHEARYQGAPFGAAYSVTLFDEFQRTTQPIRDMFLNVLENLAGSARFIFTASSDDKDTNSAFSSNSKAFLSRVTTIPLVEPNREEIEISLKKISSRLGIVIEKDVYTLITDYSLNPREYLGLLDKASLISNHICREVILAVLPKEAN